MILAVRRREDPFLSLRVIGIFFDQKLVKASKYVVGEFGNGAAEI